MREPRDPFEGALIVGSGVFLALAAGLVVLATSWWVWPGALAGGWGLTGLGGVTLAGLVLGTRPWRPGVREPFVLLTGLTMAGAALFLAVPDYSWDGRAYHLPGTILLLEGWAPPRAASDLLWLDAYPSGAWALRAVVAGPEGETLALTRLVALWAMVAAAFVVAGSARDLGSVAAVLLGVLLTLNPVVLSQGLTNYLDGYLYALALAYVVALWRGLRCGDRLSVVLAIAAGLLLVASKSAGLYYWLALTGVIVVAGVRQREALVRSVVVMGAIGALALIVCYRPYLTNLADHGTPLYPPLSLFTATQAPANLHDAGPLERLAFAIFSDAGARQGETLSLAWISPFDQSYSYDARSAGFGPVFGLMALTGLALGALGAVRLRAGKPGRAALPLLLALAAACAVTSLLFPASWWARLVPLWWAVPAIGVSLFVAGLPSRIALLVSAVAVAVALWNVSPFLRTAGSLAAADRADRDVIAETVRSAGAVTAEGTDQNYFHLAFAVWARQQGLEGVRLAPCDGPVLLERQAGQLKVCRRVP